MTKMPRQKFNILRTKKAFKKKLKTLLIFCKGLFIEANKTTFLEGESATVRIMFFWNLLILKNKHILAKIIYF